MTNRVASARAKRAWPVSPATGARRATIRVALRFSRASVSYHLFLSSVHCSLSAVTRAPFHASVLRPASQVGPVHEAAGMGKLVNAALLSLINEACVNVCCDTLLSSQLVGPACVQARSSNPRGRACRPSGKGSREEGILSGVVPVYLLFFITPKGSTKFTTVRIKNTKS